MSPNNARHESGRRHERVKAGLRKLAGALEPGSALPPRSKLLRELHIARATLTRAVQALESEGILTIRPRRGVYATARASLVTVAFVQYWQPYTLDSFAQALIGTLVKYAPDYGMFLECHLLGPYEQPDPDRLGIFHRAVKAHRYAGIVSMTSLSIADWTADLEKLGLPLAFNPVVIDYASIEQLGIGMLRQHGASKIALIDWGLTRASPDNPRFRTALARHGLEYCPEWYVRLPDELPLELNGYRNFFAHWQKWKIKPDGLLSDNDSVTHGVVRAALDLGIKIPEELQIATHANQGLSVFPVNAILRMEVDVDMFAHKMLKRLRGKIQGIAGPETTLLRLQPRSIY